MKINNNDSLSFKQVFTPGYKFYTDEQKQIVDNITTTIQQDNNIREDFIVSRLGKKKSISLFKCEKSYNYATYQDTYNNKLFIGKYSSKKPFKINDISKAQKFLALNKFKGIVYPTLYTLATTLNLIKR